MAANRVPECRVLSSPADVAAARAQGEAYQLEIAETLGTDYLHDIRRHLSTTTIHRFERERERIIPLLRDMAAGGGAPGVGACLALAGMEHDRSHLTRLDAILASAPEDTVDECLALFGTSGLYIRELPGVDLLAPRLETIAASARGDRRVAALRAAFAAGISIDEVGVVDELLRLVTGSRYKDMWIESALGLLAQRGGESGLAAARALLQPSMVSGANVRRAARSRDARLVGDLERVWDSDVKKTEKAPVLLALAHIQRSAAVPRLVEALQDKELVYYAASGLGIAAEGSSDEGIVAALAMSAAGEKTVSAHATAMASIGGPLAMRTLAGLVKRVDVTTAMSVVWRARGITLPSAIHRMVDAGVMQSMPEDATLGWLSNSEWGWDRGDVMLFVHVLRHYRRWCDVSPEDADAREAARHPVQLAQFAAASGGRVEVRLASQETGPPNARDERELTVQFVWDDRVYQMKTTAVGRSFDTRANVTMLNDALRDRGDAARFIQLQGHDYPTFLCGDERAVEAACADLLIPHGTDRDWRTAWHATLEQSLRDAGGDAPAPADCEGLGFHIVSPRLASWESTRDALDEAIAGALRTTLAIDVAAGEGWTSWQLSIPREVAAARGAAAIERLFASLCDISRAHLGRTCSTGGWARITDGELAGAIDALDWLQYFGPRFGSWVVSAKRRDVSERATPGGGRLVTLNLDPFAPSWTAIEDVARSLYLRLRPLPEHGQVAVDPGTRRQAAQPPEPMQWKPEQRSERLKLRGDTWKAIEKGMAQARLFEQFRARYLVGEMESPLLDRIATWLPHYGAEATTAAFRVVAALHRDNPAADPLDLAALEGSVKLVSWAGDDRPIAKRELLAAHLIDLKDPAMARFAHQAYEKDILGGLIKMTAMQLAACACARCRASQQRLS